MLLNIASILSSTIMSLTGIYIVKKITGSNQKIYNYKNIGLLSCLILFPIIIHDSSYRTLDTIIIYILSIVTYKLILNIKYSEAIISCAIMLIIIFFFEIIVGCMCIPFISIEFARSTWYFVILLNVIYCICFILLFYKTEFGNKINLLVMNAINNQKYRIISFLLLIIVGFCIIMYILASSFSIKNFFTKTIILFIIFYVLVIILYKERNSYYNLTEKYDNLFKYIKVFEDWIENEQFIRHEYKNQLAVLRCLTKEKKVKEKIDSIINDNINIDNNIVFEVRNLPGGGLKGLLYYKVIIAKNMGVKVTIDVENDISNYFNKLNEEELVIVTKLIGVYCDNAIEAAQNTKKKYVLIEFYVLNDNINIIISNSMQKNTKIVKIGKGVSTKGIGRGNGLYFANKLIEKNKWISSNSEIIDNFYIVKIIINKNM